MFDSDVLIGFLNRDDAHHAAAVERVRESMAPGDTRMLCAVNYAEILVGPLRSGAQDRVKQMLKQFSVEIVDIDAALAERASAVRAQTNLNLPDAFALATAIRAEHRVATEVVLSTFDDKVLRAQAELRSS